MISPFSFATETELDAITVLVNALRDARTQEDRIRTVLNNVYSQLQEAQRNPQRNFHAAAARALGECGDTDVAAPDTVDVAELNAQKVGLEQRLTQATESIATARGALRTGILDLLRECAQRAGEKYAQLANELAEHWQTLYAMESAFGHMKSVAPLTDWMTLKIPASEVLRGHKEIARREWNELLLESSTRRGVNPQGLRQEIVDHGKRLFGEWPLCGG